MIGIHVLTGKVTLSRIGVRRREPLPWLLRKHPLKLGQGAVELSKAGLLSAKR